MKTVIYARVINSVSDEPIENGMVEIEDDHIVYVGEKRESTDSDAQIFDLEGKTVMPGFIDAHAHLCGSESIHIDYSVADVYRKACQKRCDTTCWKGKQKDLFRLHYDT